MPMMKSVGRTVFGVSIGCHAFKRCCLKAVSWRRNCCGQSGKGELAARLTCRPSPATLLLLALAILVVCIVVALLLAIEKAHGCGCRRRQSDITVPSRTQHSRGDDGGQCLGKQGDSFTMVAVRAIDEITDPRKVIQRIYDDDDDRVDGERTHRLPPAVTRHFSDLFLDASDPHALDQVDISQPPSISFMLIVLV